MTATLHSTSTRRGTDSRIAADADRPAEVAVCPVDRLIPGRGVAALLPDGRQVAVYLVDDDEVHAVCNIDPVARAAVMSRGLVGDRAGVPTVISPIGKQAYSLEDGHGLDDPSRGLTVFPARVERDGMVVVSTEPAVRHARVTAA